jgi:hypothetical protein
MKITNVFHELIDLIEIIYEDSKTIINQQPSNEVDQKDTKQKLLGSLCLKMSEIALDKIAQKIAD